MLDITKIRQLIEMMVANDLVELSLRDGEIEVNLRRPTASAPTVATTTPAPAAPATDGGAAPVPPAAPAESEAVLAEIRSPMVGTYYASPDPESPPFVSAGRDVQPDTVVCIIEAMKVFNEIKAEIGGTIERVLVKNEQPVEYGQPMFLVRPHL